MTQHTWSYQQITNLVRHQIETAMQLSANAIANGDPESGRIHRLMAHGSLRAWDVITTCRQNDGDYARLESLIEAQQKEASHV